jgi:hypothetical protein
LGDAAGERRPPNTARTKHVPKRLIRRARGWFGNTTRNALRGVTEAGVRTVPCVVRVDGAAAIFATELETVVPSIVSVCAISAPYRFLASEKILEIDISCHRASGMHALSQHLIGCDCTS